MPNPEREKNAETEEMETVFGEEILTERSPYRTVFPPEQNIISGADSMRAVMDNIDHNIAECEEKIEKLHVEVKKLEQRLVYLKKLHHVSEEYQQVVRGDTTMEIPTIKVSKNGK